MHDHGRQGGEAIERARWGVGGRPPRRVAQRWTGGTGEVDGPVGSRRPRSVAASTARHALLEHPGGVLVADDLDQHGTPTTPAAAAAVRAARPALNPPLAAV